MGERLSTPQAGRNRGWLEPLLIFGLAALAVAPFVAAVIRRLGGLEFPLDDPYIYLQYARNLSAGRLFEYWPGDGYTAGCTSALYPLLLTPGFWGGLRDGQLVPYVFGLSFVLVGLSAWLAARIGRLYAGRLGAGLAVVMLLTTGSWLWGALSGLEIGLFTLLSLAGVWLVARDAGIDADPASAPASGHSARRIAAALWGTAALLGVARPEGVSISVVLIACALLRKGRRSRWQSWLVWPPALGPWLMVGLLNEHFAGHFVPNTAVGKSVMFFPRQSLWHVILHAVEQLGVLGQRLLFGQQGRWFLPLGIVLAVLAVAWTGTLAWREIRTRRAFPATFFLLSLAGGVASALTARGPGQFHRYYHHVFALASVAGGIGLASIWQRIRQRVTGPWPARLAVVASLLFLAWSGLQLSRWSVLFAQASSEIRGQQVKLATWMDGHLPKNAYVLLNDVGAMTYLSHRRSFDIVGLTTNFQASSFLEGSGSLFEGLERLPVAARPGYLAVYPEWLEMPFILGRELSRATLGPNRVVAGGRTAALFKADWSLLGSGSMPALPLPGGRVLDALDVADLVDEAAHDYRLEVPEDARGARNTTLLAKHAQVGRPIVPLEAGVGGAVAGTGGAAAGPAALTSGVPASRNPGPLAPDMSGSTTSRTLPSDRSGASTPRTLPSDKSGASTPRTLSPEVSGSTTSQALPSDRSQAASPSAPSSAGPGTEPIADGGRRVRLSESFQIDVPAVTKAGLRLRLEAPRRVRIDLRLDGAPAGSLDVPAQEGFVEVDLELPALAGHPGRHRIEARLGSGPNYRIFHYWVWGA